MPFTAADCKRLTGTDTPSYYATPPDWSLCKNLNLEGATPCWYPHCDCMHDTWSSRHAAVVQLFKTHFRSKFFK